MWSLVSAHRADDTVGLVASTIPFSSVDGPGNRFVVFLQGCNFDCVACHNPQTIDHTGAGTEARPVTVAELLGEIRRAAPFIRGVTVSGGEATQQPDPPRPTARPRRRADRRCGPVEGVFDERIVVLRDGRRRDHQRTRCRQAQQPTGYSCFHYDCP